MKKEIFYFTGAVQKITLSAFLLFGLLFLSTSMSAQTYMSNDAAMKAINLHMDGINADGIVKNPQSQTLASKEEVVMPTLRKGYGEMLSYYLQKGDNVATAIESTSSRMEARFSSTTSAAIKTEYVELLKL